jgi:amino acid adenylation domain-containing protein
LEAKNISIPDLILEISNQSENISCDVNYNADVLNTATIEQMMTHFQYLLEGIIQNDNLPIGLLPMLSPDELHRQLIEFNQPELKYIPECVHHLFEQQVSRTPDAIAVRFDNKCLSYQELNSKANQLAHRLQKYGVGPEAIVGLCMHRSPQFLISLLAVLKAGGAFLPLDPNLPADRLSFMLDDAAPMLIVTQEGLIDTSSFAQHIPFIYLDRDWPWISQESSANVKTSVEAHNLMYVIYTSGSSGKPKGVLIEHASLTGFLKAYENVIDINEHDKVLQFVPVVFDPMVEDIFCALYKGATLVLRTEDMADSAEIFFERCKQWGVTLLNLPAAFWHLLAGELTNSSALQLPASIRIVKVGGERLLPEKVDAWKKRFGDFPRLINAYGPTETTIAATMYDCTDFGSDRFEIPIGHRLINLKVYVVDNHLQPVPIGVSGELCIGGDALARGYLNRQELEDQKFIPDPFSK